MNRVTRFSVSMVVVLTLAAISAGSALATTIDYLGTDSTTGAAWRSTGVDKTAAYDPNHDNVYGSDGYYVLYGPNPDSPDNYGSWGSVALLMQSLPTYIDSVTEGFPRSSEWNTVWGVSAVMDDPSQPIGSSVAALAKSGVWQGTSGPGPGPTTSTFFTIKLNEASTFVLTTIVGTQSNALFNATAVTVTGSDLVTKTADVSSYPTYNTDYVFFKLSGNAGDTFTVSMAGPSGAWTGFATTSGIAFEAVSSPEPSSTVMVLTGAAGLLAYAWRKRR